MELSEREITVERKTKKLVEVEEIILICDKCKKEYTTKEAFLRKCEFCGEIVCFPRYPVDYTKFCGYLHYECSDYPSYYCQRCEYFIKGYEEEKEELDKKYEKEDDYLRQKYTNRAKNNDYEEM